jgi:oligoendopeptidase F
MFFKLWWKGLDDDQAKSLLDSAGDFGYWLEALRLQQPHTLSEPEEKIINLKDVNGPVALRNLYDAITNRYVYRLEVDGEELELTRGELGTYIQGPDAALRESAYQELFRLYEGDAPHLGMIYQYRVRDWRSENVGLRDYDLPISVRNLANDIPDEVVETLLQVCQENAPLFQRYFRLKAKWLGVERIRRYDVYAPVVESKVEIPYGEGVELVLESFDKFELEVGRLARKVFDEKHIDSQVRKGKRSGAFCSTISPELTPWILANYNDQPRDVATLAHELGHAVHSLLASDHTALTQNATLPLAETASTFGEMLLVDHLLEIDPDPNLQRDLLFREMDDAYATIMRQAYFAIFEVQAHDMVHDGAAWEELSAAYFDSLKAQFHDALDLSEDFRFEWLAIPHIYHTPFYVYAYAFGQLLVLSLYQQYLQEGDSFKPRYLKILSAGGSASPDSILKGAGIDMRSGEFWQGGFDVIEDSLSQLEALDIPDRASTPGG